MPSARVRGVLVDGERLRYEAELRGLTLQEIAVRTELSDSVIRKAFRSGKVERSTLYAIGTLFDAVPPSLSVAKLIAAE